MKQNQIVLKPNHIEQIVKQMGHLAADRHEQLQILMAFFIHGLLLFERDGIENQRWRRTQKKHRVQAECADVDLDDFFTRGASR
nr:hypothetical protein [Brevibacillus composti]